MKKLLRKKAVIIPIVVILVAVLASIAVRNKESAAGHNGFDGILLNRADIDTVKSMTLDDVIYFTGDLSPREQTIISSEVDARVIRVLVDEGQIVKAGQELALLDTLDLAQAVSQQEAMVAAAKAKLDLDQQKLEKQKELYRQGFISRIAYDELETNYQASLQNYKAQEALLNRNKKQLSDTHVRAPFAGIIYQKSIDEGQLALKNTKLFALANLSNMEIKAAIPSDAINRVKLGQVVLFKVETDDQIYQGKISRINQVAQSGTRSYMVYIDFANRNYGLKAGQFIKGQIILERMARQLVIPCDALRNSGEGSFVLLLSNNKITKKPVSVVLNNQQSNLCAVTGLLVNEQILAGNVLTVKPGDSAKVVD